MARNAAARCPWGPGRPVERARVAEVSPGTKGPVILA
jgi:hypothetical protein